MSRESKNLIELDRFIGNPVVRGLFRLLRRPIEAVLGVGEFNQIDRDLREKRDVEFKELNFFDAALANIQITYSISDEDRAKIPTEGPVVCVANHAYGGVDGLILGSILAGVRPDSKLLVNFILGAFEELRNWTIEVNPFGSRRAAAMNYGPLKETLRWLRTGHCLGTFPSGIVSHYQSAERGVTDPVWNSNTGLIVQKSGATVVPIYFEGRNSNAFQLAGMVHPRLRTLFLARQVANKRGRHFQVRVGKPISPQRVARFESAEALTQFMRANTYILEKRNEEPVANSSNDKKIAAAKSKFQAVAERQPVELLLKDIAALPEEALLLRKGEYSVYGASHAAIPHIMEEIGRTREETFRCVDEGTGKPLDVDRFDEIYHHLFMWNDKAQEIVGAYRYCFVDKVIETHGVSGLYCNTLYEFKRELLDALNPAIEVGRSYVTVAYQKRSASLALIWRGIGELVSRNPQYKTLFGAVSMTDSYRSVSKALMVEYLKNHKLHPTFKSLISARVKPRFSKIKNLANIALGTALPEMDDISSLVSEVEQDNKGVPILLKHYLKLNGVILCFGVDQAFSDALDGFIVVDLLRANERSLRKYMSNEGYERFIEYHEPVGTV